MGNFLNDEIQTVVLVWNRDDTEEVETIRREFAKYLEKDWIAFAVTSDGRKIQVYRFDSI